MLRRCRVTAGQRRRLTPAHQTTQSSACCITPLLHHGKKPDHSFLKCFSHFLFANITPFPRQGELAAPPLVLVLLQPPVPHCRDEAKACSSHLRKPKFNFLSCSQPSRRQNTDLQSSKETPCQAALLRASYQATVLTLQKP